MRIVAPDGSDCPAGTAGEIYVRGPGRMLEYLDAPETTHAALVGGWYRTKDMGMLDAQGYLFLSGRADDLIISGGENIYPGEVTNVIMQLCDDVAEVAVYGVPDETWGEHVKASVVLMPGSRLTAGGAAPVLPRAYADVPRAEGDRDRAGAAQGRDRKSAHGRAARAQCPGELTRASCRPCPSGARRQLLFFGEISVVKRLTVCYCEITNNQTPHSGTREYFRR